MSVPARTALPDLDELRVEVSPQPERRSSSGGGDVYAGWAQNLDLQPEDTERRQLLAAHAEAVAAERRASGCVPGGGAPATAAPAAAEPGGAAVDRKVSLMTRVRSAHGIKRGSLEMRRPRFSQPDVKLDGCACSLDAFAHRPSREAAPAASPAPAPTEVEPESPTSGQSSEGNVIVYDEAGSRRSSTKGKHLDALTSSRHSEAARRRRSVTAVSAAFGFQSHVESSRSQQRVITPASPFRAAWEFASILFLSYEAVTLPFFAAFYADADAFVLDTRWLVQVMGRHCHHHHILLHRLTSPIPSLVQLVVDFFVIDAFFFVDMYLQHSRFAYIDNGLVVVDPVSIRRRYRRRFLLRDVVANVPCDIIALVIYGAMYRGGEEGGGYPYALQIILALRLPRLLRLLRMGALLSNVQEYKKDKLNTAGMQLLKVLLVT